MKFLDNLDEDLKLTLLAQLRNLWTHTSTAIEGNTLTLGETAFVIEEGLTVAGKPLKDHEEVVGHAKAIDLIYKLVAQSDEIIETDIFALHQAIQTQHIGDIYKPIGAWKKSPNGTYAVTTDQQQVYLEYAKPVDTPELMRQWLILLNNYCIKPLAQNAVLVAYVELHVAFVRIHPFFDGNGRLARLLANLPVLKSGYPPILIAKEKRQDYIRLLSSYELTVGQADPRKDLLPQQELLSDLREFCKTSWQASLTIVENAHKTMQNRRLG